MPVIPVFVYFSLIAIAHICILFPLNQWRWFSLDNDPLPSMIELHDTVFLDVGWAITRKQIEYASSGGERVRERESERENE